MFKRSRFIRANERIHFSPLFVIDEEGTSLGSMENSAAKKLAQERGMDLVEINPSARPPVCKIMDFGRYKYELAKKEKEQKSKQQEVELKEIRLTVKISDHDLSYKAKKAREFFDHGHQVKISMRLRGRENIFVDHAYAVFNKFSEIAGLEFESRPRKSGNMIVTMAKDKKETEDKNAQIKNS